MTALIVELQRSKWYAAAKNWAETFTCIRSEINPDNPFKTRS